MNKQVSVLGGLRIAGAVVLDTDLTDFPSNAKPGTLALKDGSLHAYTTIKGLLAWYPVSQNSNDTYLHTQALPNLQWVVNHNLGNANYWYQIYDQNGNQIYESQRVDSVDLKTTTLTFNEPVSGTAIFIGPNNTVLNTVTASLITVGGVEINTAGVKVNGSYVLTTAVIDDQINNAVAVETARAEAAELIETNARVAAIDTVTAALTSEVNIRTAENATFTSSLLAETNNRASADSVIANNLMAEVNARIAADNLKADKTYVDSTFALVTGNVANDFFAKNFTVAGDILPTANGLQDIGSATNRFRTIYVNEARLSTNALYIGDTPILGTYGDTVNIKADPNQSINLQTRGTGSTLVTSEKGVSVETTGMNADVIVQANGTGSKVRLGGLAGVDVVSPFTVTSDVAVSGNTSLGGNLIISGNLTVNGSNSIINSVTVTTKDNIIVLNSGEVGSGVTAGKSGIQVDRGDQTDYQILFDETDDLFKVGMVGQLETIASRPWVTTNTASIVHNHNDATTSVSGFLSAADKTKLDGIAAGATNYSHPVSTIVPGTYTKLTIDANGHATAGALLVIGDIPNLSSIYQPINSNLTSISNISNTITGLVKLTNGVASLDNSSYLTGNQTISVSGDVSGSGTTGIVLTLATLTDSGIGAFKKITTNAKGLVTGTAPVTQSDITGLLGAASITNAMLVNAAVSNLSGANTGDETAASIKSKLGITTLSGVNTGDQTISLAGDVTGSGTGSFNVTLANTGVVAGTYTKLTVDAKGRATGGSNPTTLSGYGITDAVNTALLGVASGVATLDSSGLVPTAQLPSYVDDVLEFTNLAGFPATGETGKIYVAKDTNKIYRWSGSAYIEISPTAGNADSATKLATARTIAGVSFDGTANIVIPFANLSSIPTTLAGHGITDAALATHNHDTVYEPKNTNIQTHIASTSNPHSVTKAQVGLGNVDNTSDVNKPVSTAQQTALNLKAPLAAPALTGAATLDGIEIGYKDVPSNPQTVSYTLALSDRGKSIDFTGSTGQTITIPANASIAFPVGTVISVTNNSANALALAITTDTLRQAGTTNTGTRTIGAYAIAILRKVNATTWFVSGAGVS